MERSGSGSAETCSRHRRLSESGEAGEEDLVDCTEVSCRSCAAVLVASCVALGCCPCAAVSMLVLALVKALWALSRRFLTALLEKKRKRGRSSSRRRVGDEGGGTEAKVAGDNRVDTVGRNKSLEGVLGVVEEDVEITGWRRRRRRRSLCSICEAEKMWMEWYQLGHWGFGRVSFSGTLREGHSGKRSSGASQNAPTTLADDSDGSPEIIQSIS